ncbi:unnamed protein product [Vicia faba]|uniref:Uncharacterized protein n=1 Tax=Vicia faba TaxID=3906 RepID=A0AAV0ZQX0_VICFA|nr:unnamed protein product [Vicia faba]
MKKNAGSRLPYFTTRESNLVKGSIDFLGINFYYAFSVKNNPKSLQKRNKNFASDMAVELKPLLGNDTTTEKVKVENGLNIKGYFVWSFLDVFELLGGYESSYGIYYIDLKDPTLRRQPKLSSVWYSNFLNNRTMDSKITMKIEENSSISNTTLMHTAT